MSIDIRNIISSFSYDPTRKCLIVHPLLREVEPTPIHKRLNFLDYIVVNNLPTSREFFFEQLRPISVPYADLTRHRTTAQAEPIVMSPTNGHYTTQYDFSTLPDLRQFLANAIQTVRWQMVKSALTELGGNVVLSENLYDKDTRHCSTQVPVEEIFCRDCGFALDGRFYATSRLAHHEHFANTLQDERPDTAFLGQPVFHRIASYLGDSKVIHAKAVHAAFNQANVNLSYVDSGHYIEGGDILFDPHKGLLFIGHDENTVCVSRTNSISQLCNYLSAESGFEVIKIYRHESSLSDDDHDAQSSRFHLDTFMAILPKGELLLDARYTSTASVKRLHKIYGDKIIYVGADNPATVPCIATTDVPNSVTNLVAVGRSLLMPSCSRSLKNELRKQDYVVVTPEDLGGVPSDFYLNGGGPHCVTHTLPYKIG